jgi:hypothetical protein
VAPQQEGAGTVALVGFNPFRSQKQRASDIVMVVAGLGIVLALVLWAAFGT